MMNCWPVRADPVEVAAAAADDDDNDDREEVGAGLTDNELSADNDNRPDEVELL